MKVFQYCAKLHWIKVTKSDQSDQRTQIGQTCIKLLTNSYLFLSENSLLDVFYVVSQYFYLPPPAGVVAAEVPGGTRVISHQSETISKFAFHNPHNFTQHSKGRINPNFNNVSAWQRFDPTNYLVILTKNIDRDLSAVIAALSSFPKCLMDSLSSGQLFCVLL